MSRKVFFALFLLSSLVGRAAQASPSLQTKAGRTASIQVNTTDDELNDDGDCSLREAIRAANQDQVVSACTAGSGADTILIPAGTYNLSRMGTDDTGQLGDLDLTGSVTLQGASNTTAIINAGAGGGIFDRVFDVQPGASVTLTGMTIQGGVDNGFGGGGIRNQGTLTLANVLVIANSSSACGGGLYNSLNSTTSVNTVSFGNNQASHGGGICNDGKLALHNTSLTFDQASGSGGGIFNNTEATLERVTIASETANLHGGGIYNTGDITITNSTIQDNTATTGNGGGVFGGWITMTNTTLYNNQASTGNGGGIYHVFHLALTNVTLSANSAASGSGGGVYALSYYDATLINVTLMGNSAASGSGVFRNNSQGGKLQLKNTILRNALSGGNCGGSITSLGHNIDSGNTCGFTQSGDQINTNPLVGALANNGGTTQTHALLPGSPAINAGDNNGCPAVDQRGYPRLGGCDIGAFEFLTRLSLPLIMKSP
ncbi:MAG: choice-of-anchor Q domain-containing protein [Chloroflexota bacterium]